MDWAGLDSARFEQGFKSEDDYFMWLTCQNDHSEGTEDEKKVKYSALLEKKFPQGWKKMAGRRKEADPTKMPRGHGKIRLEVMARFRDWLLTTAYGVEAPVSPRVGHPVGSTTTDSTEGVTTGISNLKLPEKIVAPPMTPVSAREQNLLDPERYQQLSPDDISALKHFGKIAQWQTVFDGRKQEAKVMADRQKRKVKENTDHQKAKEEAKPAKDTPISVKEEVAVVAGSGSRRDEVKTEDMDEGVSL